MMNNNLIEKKNFFNKKKESLYIKYPFAYHISKWKDLKTNFEILACIFMGESYSAYRLLANYSKTYLQY